MYRPVSAIMDRGEGPTDSMDAVVTLDQVPRWSLRCCYVTEDQSLQFPEPLTLCSEAESIGIGMISRFPVDHEINSKIYLWRGNPWNLEADAVVNSTNENMDIAHCSPDLHAAAGPGLAEEVAAEQG